MINEKNMTKIISNNQEIYLKDSLFLDAPNFLNQTQTVKECFIVTDQHVYDLYKDLIEDVFKSFDLNIVVVKPGESSKSFETYIDVINQLLNKKIKRYHTLIALGGGVIGDLTGFVASTLYRGIAYIQIPTTLLAQVDSSIGAKTGIDHKQGKNLIGSFYAPKYVLIDPMFLRTLSKRHYHNGMAEIIKAGLIHDQSLFEALKYDYDILDIIYKAILVKKHFVDIDPFDYGERKKLNFGHTYAHALETALNYNHLLHGEAVSIGMMKAIELGIKNNITSPHIKDDVAKILKKYDLIQPYPSVDEKQIKTSIAYDKKNTAQGIDFIFIDQIGHAVIKKIEIDEVTYDL